MTASEALATLRRGPAPAWRVGASAITILRRHGHTIVWDRIDDEAIYTLEKDACICHRMYPDGSICGEKQVKGRPTFMCVFCAVELGLEFEPKLAPPPKTHCKYGHPLIEGNLLSDGKCYSCHRKAEHQRKMRRLHEKAEAA